MITGGYCEKYEAIQPSKVDMMLSDVDDELLRNVGIKEGIEYLSKGKFFLRFFPVTGTIYGPNKRLFICLTCRDFDKHDAPIVNVWFVVDTESLGTFINKKTMKALTGSDHVYYWMRAAVQDPNICNEFYSSHSHFKEANVLGMEAILRLGVTIEGIDWEKNSFRLEKYKWYIVEYILFKKNDEENRKM
ncbi:hypothetical protein Mgra_00010303 [Meloidogyne graminicola]|uniref:Uncharacterized protein n=1 Tax=Meloidogyne graminicola TaxID=189291 RepID=A0A8S9ZCN2_9BILA|nr:hypothetical protein Mgra_00010303 [Meloidogyne graminicola]